MLIVVRKLLFLPYPMLMRDSSCMLTVVLLLILNIGLLSYIIYFFKKKIRALNFSLLSLSLGLNECRSVVNHLSDTVSASGGECAAESETVQDKSWDSVPDDSFIDRLNFFIGKNLASADFSVDSLAKDLCVSRSSLFTKVREATGETPNNLLNRARLDAASKLLEKNERAVNEISYMVGFSSPSYFSRCFVKRFGLTPHEWANRSRLS